MGWRSRSGRSPQTELPTMLEVDRRGFGAPLRTPEQSDSWVTAELDRTRCAWDAGTMVGCTRAYSFELTMPGGALGARVRACPSVAVQPTHRRRGVLTAMMSGLHDDARARGEIGRGAHRVGERDLRTVRIRAGHMATRARRSNARARSSRGPVDDPGSMRLVARGEADAIYQAVYDRARRRARAWCRVPTSGGRRSSGRPIGERALFDVVHEDAEGNPDGYVSYEIKGEWDGRRVRGPVHPGVGPPGHRRPDPRRAVGVRVRCRSRR